MRGLSAAAAARRLTAASVKAEELPESTEELLKYADDQMKKDSVVAAENSLVALEKAIGAHAVTVIGRDYDALWRAARACAWLAEDFTDKKTREQFAYHGIEYAKAASALEPRRVEGHYYLGINTGLSATTKTITAYNMVPKVRDAAKAALKADEKFDHAGPLRLLGGVFAKAPSWPASIGDVEEGQKYLSRAVKLAPEYPENHLLYGDALAADSKPGGGGARVYARGDFASGGGVRAPHGALEARRHQRAAEDGHDSAGLSCRRAHALIPARR